MDHCLWNHSPTASMGSPLEVPALSIANSSLVLSLAPNLRFNPSLFLVPLARCTHSFQLASLDVKRSQDLRFISAAAIMTMLFS